MNIEDMQREFKNIHQRIGAIEERCTCKVKWKAEIERRVEELEDKVFPGMRLFVDKVLEKKYAPMVCVAGDEVYLSNPPQYRCKTCFTFWTCSDKPPVCKGSSNNAPAVEQYLRTNDKISFDRNDLEELLNKSVMTEYNGEIIRKLRKALGEK